MATSEQTPVYTFKNVSLTAGGGSYAVSSITIILRENAIPTARVVIDPLHGPSDPPTPATKASLSTLAEKCDALQKSAVNKESASLTLEVDNNEGAQQELNLSGWKLTAAGVPGISASGAFTFEVEMQHPICLINYCGLNLTGFTDRFTLSSEAIASSDIVSALAEFLVMLSQLAVDTGNLDASCGSNVSSPAAAISKAQSKLIDAADTIDAHLLWDTSISSCSYNDLPLNTCFSNYQNLILKALSGYISNGMDANVWEVFSRHICPQWFVSIIPTYWKDTLSVTPFTPWDDPQIYISDTDISDLNFPGVDPNPLAGVYIESMAPGITPCYTVFVPTQSDVTSEVMGMLYVPESTDLIGSIVTANSPGWIDSVIASIAGYVGDQSSPEKAEDDDGVKTPANSANSDESKSESDDALKDNLSLYRGAWFLAAQTIFMTLFRQDVQVTLQCALMIQCGSSMKSTSDVEDDRIIPGVSCTVKGDGGNLFNFYVTDVIHVIDCQAGHAHTEIQGRYARPDGGFEGVMPEGTCNPIWAD